MSRLIRVFRAAGRRFSAEGVPFMAQSIAFTALFALVPLSIVAVAMLAFIYGTADGMMRANLAIQQYVPALSDLVSNNLAAIVRYRGFSGAIGLIGLIWSGTARSGLRAFATSCGTSRSRSCWSRSPASSWSSRPRCRSSSP
jgi:uncharacterized BrkB/YihY/UPF0761 family membrane protein